MNPLTINSESSTSDYGSESSRTVSPVAEETTTKFRPVTNPESLEIEDEDSACADVFGVKKDTDVVLDVVKEEIKVEAENIEEIKKEEAKAEYVELTADERYERLLDLLKKSSFYSNFLLDKIQNQDEESKKLMEKKLKNRKSSIGTKNEGKKETPKPTRSGRKRTKKRGREEDDESENAAKKPKIERKFKDQDIPEEQPLLLTGGLMRDYQLKGYQWMATLWENGINGILADEMGLGKTIQTIALFCHLVEMGVPGPFLIVAPLSTISNWVSEFHRFAPSLPVVLYHGSQDVRAAIRHAKMNQSHVVEGIDTTVRNIFVTSYEIAMRDRVHFRALTWRFIVVDEGHRLKNTHCKLIQELKQYDSANRLLLTGTPLQNNLAELWSLLNFLMPEIFDDLRVFESWFSAKDIDQDQSEADRIVNQEKHNNILSTLHQILTPFLLRRVKADVDLKIPPKKELLVYCPMTEKQQELYEATVNKTIAALMSSEESKTEAKQTEETGRGKRKKRSGINYNMFIESGAGGDSESDKKVDKYFDLLREMQKERDMTSGVNTYTAGEGRRDAEVKFSTKSRMMDLRKTTNHPYLIEYPLTEDGNFYRIDQDLIDVCGKLKVMDQMLDKLIARKHKILIFSQMTRMLDIIGDYLSFKELRHSRLDGTMGFEERQENIDSFNTDDDVRVFLLSTRAGGLGINLTAADTVIIYDSDWNPQQDLQAQDRCHRIGQEKPVLIFRLVTAKTMDEKIVERAAAKRKLEKMVIHRNKFKSQDQEGLKKTMEAITPHELLELLHSKDHSGVVDRKDGAIFTENELEALLDRSDLVRGGPVKKSRSKKAERVFKVVDVGNDDKAFPSVL